MILFLHNRYRTTGGEERVVEDLLWLVREYLDEPAELLLRDSGRLGRARAALALLAGGAAPQEVGDAVRAGGVRVLHAHNLNPLFGWRALAAARQAGARVVLHLHQYRLVCAVGVCFTDGRECVRCHGRNTLPGVIHNCRRGRGEALSYAAALALWQRRVLEQADAVIAPSAFAVARLRQLGVPLPEQVEVIAPPLRELAASGGAGAVGPDGGVEPRAAAPRDVAPHEAVPLGLDRGTGAGAGAGDGYALVASRLAPEKGVEVAIDACARTHRPLVIAGDGPLRAELEARAQRLGTAASVSFAGRVSAAELERLRAGAALALVPSLSAETFGLAAAEAMAAGLPVLASSIGALPELVPEEGLVPPGEPDALAAGIERLWADRDAGERARTRVAEICAPSAVARALGVVYEQALGGRGGAPRQQ